jgi:hypothetical protein
LDVDGVLNTSSFRDSFGATRMNPFLDDNLIEIINLTDCKIIISSTWKFNMDDIKDKLYCEGFVNKPNSNNVKKVIDSIIGCTLDLDSREQEIIECVREYGIKNWVAIDDMELGLPDSNFVLTDDDIGLNEMKMREAVEKLNGMVICKE